MSLTSEYRIRLDIDNQDKTLLQINDMERGFKRVTNAAKQVGNSLDVDGNLSQMGAQTDKLRSQLLDIARTNRKALPEAMKAYQRCASKTMSTLEAQYGKLARVFQIVFRFETRIAATSRLRKQSHDCENNLTIAIIRAIRKGLSKV